MKSSTSLVASRLPTIHGEFVIYAFDSGHPELPHLALTHFSKEKNEVTNVYPVKLSGGAHPIALDEANHRVYLGCRKEPMVVAVDTETGKEVGSAPIPDEVDDLFFDAARKRLFASCGEGFLAVLKVTDAGQLELVEKIPTAKGARTCLYVPETGKLYLVVPRQEGKDGPEIRIFQVKK